MAEEARRAWAHLQKVSKERAWMRHQRQPHGTARDLAAAGKCGVQEYAAVVD